MKSETKYKSCRYNGKRMRQHRAVFLSIVEKFSFTKAERDEYMSGLVVHHINGDKKDTVVATYASCQGARMHGSIPSRGTAII